MDDARAVQGLDRAADLNADLQGVRDRERLLAQPGAQVRGRAVLHDEVHALVPGLARTVHGDDRGVRAHAGHQIGLGAEGLPLGVGHAAAEDLDRHFAAGDLLLVEVHVRETTGSEE